MLTVNREGCVGVSPLPVVQRPICHESGASHDQSLHFHTEVAASEGSV